MRVEFNYPTNIIHNDLSNFLPGTDGTSQLLAPKLLKVSLPSAYFRSHIKRLSTHLKPLIEGETVRQCLESRA